MNLTRALWLGGASGAVVVWMAAGATSVSRPSTPSPRLADRAVEASGAQLASEITKLHERLRPTATPSQSRDLFRYAPSSAVSAVGRAASLPLESLAPSPVTLPAPPLLTLVGIAEDGAADTVVRTAIVSGFNDLFLVKEGEGVTLRYRVAKILPDAVELIDSLDQSLLRLPLK